MSDVLVERVARVICETENGPCKCMPDECGCTYWRAHARASIAVALEEAAKVADRVADEAAVHCREALLDDARAIAEQCADEYAGAQKAAAAIRALKEEK